MRVLILEDDTQYRIPAFRQRLEGHDITVTTTANEAIEQLASHDFDLIFLDHDLGGEAFTDSSRPNTGAAAARWIAQHRERVKGKVVIHSFNYPGAKVMREAIPDADYLPGCWLKDAYTERDQLDWVLSQTAKSAKEE